MAESRFKYQTSFIPVSYEREQRGMWIFKQEALPIAPDPASLYANRQYQEHMDEMGASGWELVSVQPLLRGVYQFKKDNQSGFGLGYSLTAGYYLFWKRNIANE